MLLVPGIALKELTGSSGAAALTLLAFMAPICVAPTYGWIIDRAPRRTFVLATNLLSALALLPAFWIDGREDWWIVYLVSAAMGTSYVCNFGALNGVLQTMLPELLLPDANGAIQSVRQGLRLVGPLLGAAMYSAWGFATVAAFNMLSFLVAAALIGILSIEEPRRVSKPRRRLSSLVDGARSILRDRMLRQTTLILSLMFVVGGASESVAYTVVEVGLNRPAQFIGVMSSIMGVGAIFGGLMAPMLIRKCGETLAAGLGCLAYGAATALLGLPFMTPILVAKALAGAGLTVATVSRLTHLQRRTPIALIGRASAAYDAVAGTCQISAIAIGVFLASFLDYRVMLLLFGGLAVGCGLISLRSGALYLAARKPPSASGTASR